MDALDILSMLNVCMYSMCAVISECALPSDVLINHM